MPTVKVLFDLAPLEYLTCFIHLINQFFLFNSGALTETMDSLVYPLC